MLNDREKQLLAVLKTQTQSKKLIAGIMANAAIESTRLTVLVENLNYKAERLVEVFPKYFHTLAVAVDFHRHPQKIANKVYANRMGNGSEESGDGWKYIGRGIIQLTGKDNYARLQAYSGLPLLVKPEILEDFDLSVMALVWFFFVENLSRVGQALVSQDYIKELRKVVNGGVNGLADVRVMYDYYLKEIEHASA